MIEYLVVISTLTLGLFLILVIAELMALNEIKSWKRNTRELVKFPLNFEPLKGDRGNGNKRTSDKSKKPQATNNSKRATNANPIKASQGVGRRSSVATKGKAPSKKLSGKSYPVPVRKRQSKAGLR